MGGKPASSNIHRKASSPWGGVPSTHWDVAKYLQGIPSAHVRSIEYLYFILYVLTELCQ